ncbi:hypothetical protein C8Q80DRAFT_1265033 [Daedaleopsis nitida]|nr:hypothetical protein C8Q80DRAFT_1265033 [Daedaleopsis nitida]
MPSPDLHLVVPHVPAAWSSPSREHNDQDADVDVSSVSSHGSFTLNLRARKDSNRKARRRWTYAGPTQPYVRPTRSASPDCPTSGPLLGARASPEANMSPVTDKSVSTARSSPLNTPDLADWPTRLGGSQSLLLDHFAPSGTSPSSVSRYNKLKASPVQQIRNAICRPSRFSSPVARNQIPSSRLDPPLSNIFHGLLPLTLSFPDLTVDFPFPEPPSAPPSPRSTAAAIRSLHPLDPSTVSINWSPLAEESGLSPQFLVSSTSFNLPPHDSPILPPRNVGPSPCEDQDDDDSQLPPPVQDMDAFALATAVAASASRSSFTLPPSIHATVPLPSVVTSTSPCTVPRPGAYRASSAHTEASVGHPFAEALPCLGETVSMHTDNEGLAVPSAENQARARRSSAPQPTAWQSPRLQPTRTISSRVDVGADIATGKKSRGSRPVMGKVRKFGERIRGLFKGKPDDSSQGRVEIDKTPEYGVMTTTTAVTNVEYESHHPIPLPSPRTKLMRSHRRSLPLPLFIPNVMDRNHTSPCSELPITEEEDVSKYASTFPQRDGAAVRAHMKTAEHELSSYDLDETHRSPRTPKARRQRPQSSSQTKCDEPEAHDQPHKTKSLRRFSLSSVLTKTKIDPLRSTVVSRPPLPTVSSRNEDETAPSYTQRLNTAPRAGSSTTHASNLPACHGRSAPSRGQFWGGELPNVQPLSPDLCVARSSSEGSPGRPRIPITPSQPPTPSQLETGDLVPKEKRSRRFSLSSFMARRPLLAPTSSQGQDSVGPVTPRRTSILGRRRPRGDTVTTATPSSIVASEPDHALLPPTWELPPSHRNSVVSSSSGAESMYFDAREDVSDDDHLSSLERPSSHRSESDLDSMSFARTPEYSSGTLSFGSSTEREYYLDITNDTSTSASHPYRHSAPNIFANPNTLAHLVGDSSSTPLTKTLRFSPSLTLSFDLSRSDYEDEDEDGRMEQEEELSFMRALGFEFDEIARRVREEPL